MSIPGFTAVASLGPAAGIYHGPVVFGGGGLAEALSPQAIFGVRRFAQSFPCCGKLCSAPNCGVGCRQCFVPPGHNCSCLPGFALCSCRPQVLTQD